MEIYTLYKWQWHAHSLLKIPITQMINYRQRASNCSPRSCDEVDGVRYIGLPGRQCDRQEEAMTSLTSNQFTILFKCFIRSIGSSHNSLPDSTCCTDPAISLNPAGCEPAMNNLIINQCHNVRISHQTNR